MSIQTDLDRIALQERELQLPSFDPSVAWALGNRLRDLAESRNLPVVIDVRRFGHPLFYAALSGTTPDNREWVRRKNNVVRRFLRSSYGMGLMLQRDKNTLFEKFGLPLADYAAHGGAFPLAVAHCGVLGSITVSGLPQRADHELVVEALCAALGRDYGEFALEQQ